MFGNSPKEVWQRWLQPDQLNRLEFSCRALLIEDGTQKTLIETGIGAFFEPKLRERYGIFQAEHRLLQSLAALGLEHTDIDNVVLSHLHFDHAGGLLSQWQEGEPPKLLFDRARFIVGRSAYQRAKNPHPRDRASFIAELPRLFEASGRLCIVESPSEAESLLGPAFRFYLSEGHTPGMLHTEVKGQKRGLFFCADLVPGAPWVHLPITMGYDRYPERLVDEKAELYARLIKEQTWLFFTHDPTYAASQLGQDEKGRYTVVNPIGDFDWDLDT